MYRRSPTSEAWSRCRWQFSRQTTNCYNKKLLRSGRPRYSRVTAIQGPCGRRSIRYWRRHHPGSLSLSINTWCSWCQSGGFLFDFRWHTYCICHHLAQYLACNVDDLEVGQCKLIQDQSTQWPTESPLMVSYLTSFKSNILSVFIFEIFDEKSCGLDLGLFKVIQGQMSWCQSIAQAWFCIRLPLIDPIVVSVIGLEIFDIKAKLLSMSNRRRQRKAKEAVAYTFSTRPYPGHSWGRLQQTGHSLNGSGAARWSWGRPRGLRQPEKVKGGIIIIIIITLFSQKNKNIIFNNTSEIWLAGRQKNIKFMKASDVTRRTALAGMLSDIAQRGQAVKDGDDDLSTGYSGGLIWHL